MASRALAFAEAVRGHGCGGGNHRSFGLWSAGSEESSRRSASKINQSTVRADARIAILKADWRLSPDQACAGRRAGVCFFHAGGAVNRHRSKKPGGSDSPQGLILFDGVCVLLFARLPFREQT
jgi:hypothetical protein